MAYMLDLLQHRQEGPELDGGISSQHKGITCNMGLLCRRQVTLHLCYMDTQIPGKVFLFITRDSIQRSTGLAHSSSRKTHIKTECRGLTESRDSQVIESIGSAG